MENSKSKLAGESLGNDIYSAMKRITHFQYKLNEMCRASLLPLREVMR